VRRYRGEPHAGDAQLPCDLAGDAFGVARSAFGAFVIGYGLVVVDQ
jgi:hypothetical protein